MKSNKISTLTAGVVLLLAGGMLSGCSDKPEDAANVSAEQSKEVVAAEATPTPTVSGVGDAAADMANEAVESTSEMLGAATETTSEVIDSGAETISQTTDEIVGLAGDTVDDAQGAAQGLIDDAQSTTSSAISSTQDAASSAVAATQAPALASDATDVVAANPAIIRGIQQGLVNAGFNPGPVDGMSGAKTQDAMESFQRQNNLAVGKITKETLRALGVNF